MAEENFDQEEQKTSTQTQKKANSKKKNNKNMDQSEHSVLQKIRDNAKKNREIDDEVYLESLDVSLRLWSLSHTDYMEAYKAAGINPTDETAENDGDNSTLAFEMILRAITHIDDVPIEELFFGDVHNRPHDQQLNLRHKAVARLREYLLMYLTLEDVSKIITAFNNMPESKQGISEEVKNAPKKN